MLAWVGTATSLTTFWLQRFQILSDRERGGGATELSHGARQFGLLLVSIGLISLVLATPQYQQNIRCWARSIKAAPLTGGHRGRANFNSRRPRIDCDDFSRMIPEQFRKDLQAPFDAHSKPVSNDITARDEIS
jgi:hypothetical protein